jgi:hypothetical protein
MFKNKLKKITELVTGLVAAAVGLVGVAGEKDLYSDVQAGSVFAAGDSSKAADSVETPRIARRITSLEQLARLVRDANYESKTAEARTVTTIRSLEPWRFPVSVTLSDDEQTLQIDVALGAVSDKQKVDAAKLLSLLEANKLQANARFGFNSARSRTELLGQIRNDGVTGELLRDEINRLALIAKESSPLWEVEPARTLSKTESSTTAPESAVRLESVLSPAIASANSSNPATGGNGAAVSDPLTTAGAASPTSIANIPATPSVTPLSSPAPTNIAAVQPSAFTGRWSASRASYEAFAILFDANGAFVLVSVRDGKQAKSSGKFSVSGSELTLESTDGTRLYGTFQLKSASEFSFQPSSTTGTVAAFNFRKSP